MPFRTWPGKKSRKETSASLFPDAKESTKKTSAPHDLLIAFIDGGARGNPGPAGYGVHLEDASGTTVAELSEYLGHKTNNVAEYSGLIAALDYAVTHERRALKVVSDSELLVKQMRGEYKVKSPDLKVLYEKARGSIRKLDHFEIHHVLRAKNRDADRLANAAMDKGMGRSPVVELEKPQEFNGIVRSGVVELLSGELPEGTRVKVRVHRVPRD